MSSIKSPRYTKPKMAAADAAEMGVEDLEAHVRALIDNPPKIKGERITRKTATRYLSNGSRVSVTTQNVISGMPEYVNFKGHEVDNAWQYPLIESKVIAGPTDSVFVSQAEAAAALKA